MGTPRGERGAATENDHAERDGRTVPLRRVDADLGAPTPSGWPGRAQHGTRPASSRDLSSRGGGGVVIVG